MEASTQIEFSDLFDLKNIQHMQDLFSDATGVASIITYPDGRPITEPSNFCKLCNEIIRKTDSGLTNCFKSDAEIGRPNPAGPIIQPCLSGGLWDAGASIIVEGKHIANWLIGQVKNEDLDYDQMIKYSEEIGADKDSFIKALGDVPVMSKEKFEKIANMLYVFVSEISSKAFQNKKLVQSLNELEQAREKLSREHLLINTLLKNVPDHIYFKDCDSRFLMVNATQVQSFGLTDEEQLLGKTDFDFFSREHAQQAYDDEQTIIRTGLTLIKEERETWPDRADTWVYTTKVPMHDLNGKIIGTFGISKDITKLKELENALLVKQSLLEGIIENIPDQVYYKDRNSRFVICNKPVALLAGCKSEKDMIGKSDFDFHPHDLAQQYYNDEQTLMENDQKFLDHEEEILDKESGEFKWNLSSKVPVKDTQGNVIGLAGINRDITGRRRAEEEINLKNELLQTINAEKDKFFSILAHDLKGPLSAFLDATQILTEEIQNVSLDDIREITINMKESASNIYGLLENLLEWSRLKRGRMEFSPERISVKNRCLSSTEVLKESAQKKQIRINYDLPGDLSTIADPQMFDTIVRNLVSNAIKFTPKTGEIFISGQCRHDDIVEISIRDTGIGMQKEMISKLFLLNERTNRKGTDGEPSTGLGLLLCKEFIDKHNGRIWVESDTGKGSTFFFTLNEF